MKLYLANPHGFCAGVDRAIDIVERALNLFSAPIYVRHEVVHNRYVVNDLMKKGAIFVEELDEIPDGATVIFSAHGVSQQVRNEANKRDLRIFDATCPLVTKVHLEVARHEKKPKMLFWSDTPATPKLKALSVSTKKIRTVIFIWLKQWKM